MTRATFFVISFLFLFKPEAGLAQTNEKKMAAGTYGYDFRFLKQHTRKTVELKNAQGARVLLSADYQGRVMTSTASGDQGSSFGWINYDLISSGTIKTQFNPVGGEERFWLGPEGGQYALYFKKGHPFVIEHWQVPYCIDTVSYLISKTSDSSVSFSSSAVLQNYSGTIFSIDIHRTVRLYNKQAIEKKLTTTIPADVNFVAYESSNSIKNNGPTGWQKETGLLSIWLLGMMTPTEQTVAIIPFSPGTNSRDFINDNYFGTIPADRLMVSDSVLFFLCDGKYRSKLGLSPSIARSIAASFDFEKNVLTTIHFPVEIEGQYVNSKWEQQEYPYRGDVVNSYNDGPLAGGGQLGPFYELESSSSAKELNPGEEQNYVQLTCHFQGNYSSMRDLTSQLLHVDLDKVKGILPKPGSKKLQ